MNFFFDNNLSPNLARALDKLAEPEHRVFHLIDKFAANATDAEWLAGLSEESNWVIITADLRIGKITHEIRQGRRI